MCVNEACTVTHLTREGSLSGLKIGGVCLTAVIFGGAVS